MTRTRLLFVDDVPEVLEGLADLLERNEAQWDMDFVSSGEEALAALATHAYDVVISDMRMPNVDGATLLSRVQLLQPGAVRIVLSGYSELEAAMRAVPVAHQFITKPCDASELENVIERACRLHLLIHDERLRDVVGRVQRLPSNPRVYGTLTRMLSDERTTSRDIAGVVARDMAMCAKILQLVNSSFLGVGRRISSIDVAVSYLGTTMVKNLVLMVEIFDVARQPRLASFSLEALQRDALEVAGVAREVAGDDRRLADDAFIAALLRDVGVLVLATELPHPYADALRRAREERRPLVECEREECGATHAEVGAYLLGLWGLPYPIVEAVAHHHDPRQVRQRGLDALAAIHIAEALTRERAPSPAGDGAPLDEAYVRELGCADHLPRWRRAVTEMIAGSQRGDSHGK